MAFFVASGPGVRMGGLDFLDLATLKGPALQLESTEILKRTRVSPSSVLWQAYEGAFTYDFDGSGKLVAVHGEVTEYQQFLSADEPSGFLFYRLSLDVSALVGLGDAQIARLILAGNDVVDGTSGADQLLGYDGTDSLEGHLGDDTLDGGDGVDRMSGSLGDDRYIVDNTLDKVMEGRSRDRDTVESSVAFRLPDFVERLILVGTARSGHGNDRANRITGNNEANLLKGGDGRDTLRGGEGDDHIYGNRDADVLTGGAGADTFACMSALDSHAGATDLVVDFEGGTDVLDLQAVDARSGVDGNQQFAFIGSAEFSTGSAAGELRYVYDGATGIGTLSGSTDDDADPEFVLQLTGVAALEAADLVL